MKRSTTLSILIAAIMVVLSVQVCAQCIQCSGGSVTGNAASVMGLYNNAHGEASFAGGYNCTADGFSSFSFGAHSIASGTTSVTIGHFLETSATHAMVIGRGASLSDKLTNNIPHSLMVGFGSEKPTLFIGGTGPGYTGKIGIGNVTDPEAKLHIKADNYEQAEVLIEPHLESGAASLWLGNKQSGVRKAFHRLEFRAGSGGIYYFPDGNIGVRTSNPIAELQVNGNVFIEKENAGLILKSPDGQCWKITVNNNGELATSSVNCDLTTSIDLKNQVENNIRIFPNPTSGELTIETGQELHNGRVSVYSMEGRQLYTEPLKGRTAQIDLSHLQPGVYIVNIEGGGRLIKAQQLVLK